VSGELDMVDFRELIKPEGFRMMLWGRFNPPKMTEWEREYQNNPMEVYDHDQRSSE
jgi:hypothetical protein